MRGRETRAQRGGDSATALRIRKSEIGIRNFTVRVVSELTHGFSSEMSFWGLSQGFGFMGAGSGDPRTAHSVFSVRCAVFGIQCVVSGIQCVVSGSYREGEAPSEPDSGSKVRSSGFSR